MLEEKDLNKCIENLAEINAAVTSSSVKQLVLEVGYILAHELDNVKMWNRQIKGANKLKGYQVDIDKVFEDNAQLFNENQKLQEANLKLKEVIDKKIPNVENMVGQINQKIETFSEILLK